MTQISQATIAPDASIAPQNNGKGPAAHHSASSSLHVRNLVEEHKHSGEPYPYLDGPTENGLLIALDADGTCSMTFEPDYNWTDIHPNAYAPKDLTSVKVLQGGGSGVTVFQGTSPSLGSLVMKHGRPSDSREVFSLALISRELVVRGALHPEAASNMRSRIPEFKMVYISPHHLRNRGTELWIQLKANVIRHYARARRSSEVLNLMEQSEHLKNMKQIRVYHCPDDSDTTVNQCHSNLDLSVNFDDITEKGVVIRPDRGFPILIELMRQLIDEQERNLWKFTIAQKTIGGPEARNGAFVHTQGLLTGEMLATVVDQFIQVIENLVVLTRDDEKAGVAEVRKEVAILQQQSDPCCSSVSKLANLFCGKAIEKNFDPNNGRLAQLESYGERFRKMEFDCLEECEHRPTRHLGLLLQKGATMDHLFEGAPSSLTAFEVVQGSWLGLLAGAASLQPTSATDFIWTNGLTDAGLHNTFLRHDFLWLFDLGEPERMPIPAFLTKFLMSFMHVFGMEDNDDGSWVCRFVETDNGKLALTPETVASLPKMHETFEYALNRFVGEVFHGDEEVRKVLLNYVVLQIVSDAAFCLGRWESKGGGEKKYYTCNRGQNLHKWLWRSLWDLYIATDVLNRWKCAMQD
mmetsp:Transcript_18938/g.31355  ORF Transcript_18938/g.31355 Transcript_18938/m.31355 type:complete len:634 (+) Transcript_18938:84-1985(+)